VIVETDSSSDDIMALTYLRVRTDISVRAMGSREQAWPTARPERGMSCA